MSADEIDPDDDAAWQAVAKTVTPLGERKKPELPKNKRPDIRNPRPAEVDERIIFGGAEGHAGPAQTGISKREKRKLTRGTTEVDSVVDLHNDTREAAYKRLLRHLRDAHMRGDRVVLVITGKGGRRFSQSDDLPVSQRKRSDFELGEGVLRQALPGWLNGADMNQFVAAFTQAGVAHGGEGAFYVRLRGKGSGWAAGGAS